jgi:tetratricopeptide (TPR) repeat protein
MTPLRIPLLVLTIAMAASVGAQDEPTPAPKSPIPTLSPAELNIWHDPAFQKRFAESYIAETEIEPRVTAEEREQMIKIMQLIDSNKMDEAVKTLEKSRGEAASAVYDFTLANICFQAEQFDKAADAYQQAVEKHAKFRRAWGNLALIHIRQGKFADALPALIRVVELGGGDSTIYGLLGYAHAMLDNNLAAESAYRQAILLDPATLDWQMGLARSFFKQDRFAEAAAICGQLLKAHPDRTDLWLLQANAFIGLNQPLKAAQNYELVEQFGKSTTDSLNMMGDIYVNEELYGLAVKAYGEAMEKEAAKPDRAVRSAKILAARGALEETRHLLEKIESLFSGKLPDDLREDMLKLRARIVVASADAEKAGAEEARVLEQIIELDPLDGEALILLGQHATRKGDKGKAIFYYERAEAIEKYEADAKVRHAQLLVSDGKYDAALPLLRRALQINPRENIQEYL